MTQVYSSYIRLSFTGVTVLLTCSKRKWQYSMTVSASVNRFISQSFPGVLSIKSNQSWIQLFVSVMLMCITISAILILTAAWTCLSGIQLGLPWQSTASVWDSIIVMVLTMLLALTPDPDCMTASWQKSVLCCEILPNQSWPRSHVSGHMLRFGDVGPGQDVLKACLVTDACSWNYMEAL